MSEKRICPECNTEHHIDKMNLCSNCSLVVCSLCSQQCIFCKVYFCNPCCDDIPDLLIKRHKIRYSIKMPGYGVRITDDIAAYEGKYQWNEVDMSYQLCYMCHSSPSTPKAATSNST